MLKVRCLTLCCACQSKPPVPNMGFCVVQVDQRLQTKVFLAGMSVTLADLVMFATLYRALVGSRVTLSLFTLEWY